MTVPAAPTNLVGVALSDTEIALTWDPVPGAVAYQIYRNGVLTAASTEPFFNLTGLTANTSYSIYLRTEAFSGIETTLSPPSATIVVQTLAAPPSPGPITLDAPVIRSAVQSATDAITFNWDPVEDAEGYEYRLNGGSPDDAGNTLGATVPELELGSYDVEVRAYADGGSILSDWSVAATVVVATIGKPVLSATVVSSGLVQLAWTAVPPADSYTLRIDGGFVVDGKEIDAGSLLEYLDSDIAPQTTRSYEVRGRIRNTSVVGPWSDPVTITTNRSAQLRIIGLLQRLSTFAGDRDITAAAINTELNNIYALINGGTLEVTPGDPLPPLPDPEPLPPPPILPPEPPTPPPPPPPAPPPDPTPTPPPATVPGFPGPPTASDPARPAGWVLENQPDADLPSRVATSWEQFFQQAFPAASAKNLRIRTGRYVAFAFNTGTLARRGQINFADLTGNIINVGQRPALVTISPYAGDFRLSLGAPYYRLIGVGGAQPAYRWTRTQGDPSAAYLPPNTLLYLNIAFVSEGSQNAAAGNLVWECTSTFPNTCGYRLYPTYVP